MKTLSDNKFMTLIVTSALAIAVGFTGAILALTLTYTGKMPAKPAAYEVPETVAQAVMCQTDKTLKGEFLRLYETPEAWSRKEINQYYMALSSVKFTQDDVQNLAMGRTEDGRYFSKGCHDRAKLASDVKVAYTAEEKRDKTVTALATIVPLLLACAGIALLCITLTMQDKAAREENPWKHISAPEVPDDLKP